jgi:8-amino-7-oxononanoate synthase
MGTFGKACGAFGAYLCCSKDIAAYLINCCAGLIYSTALPPAVLGTIDASLELLPAMTAERKYLAEMSEYLRAALNELRFNTGESSSQIIPIIIGAEKETLQLSGWLAEHAILASAIRPPTVEQGKARIRLTLSALHTKEQIDYLIHVLQKWQQEN